MCSAVGVRFAGEKSRFSLLSKNFSREVALFAGVLRVTGCGLFFASLIAVQRSNQFIWELRDGKFVRYE
jgi:hypothetical protein